MELQLTGYVLLKHEVFVLFYFFKCVSNVFLNILIFRIAKITNKSNRDNILKFKFKLYFRGTGSSDDAQILSGCIFNGL